MPGPGYTPLLEIARRKMHIKNEYVREAIAEVFGTAILCLFAVGAGIQYTLQDTPGHPASSVQPTLGGVFGIMTAILVTGGVSGAHMNPAVTLGLAIAGETSWYKVPLYWVAQILGGYIGAGFASLMYYWTITLGNTVAFAKSGVITAGVYSHIGNIPLGTLILDQVTCAFVLMIGVMGVIDKRNMQVPKHMIAFLICLIVAGISLCFGAQGGAVMNPARDLGPRLMALTLGFSSDEVMKSGGKEHWWLGMMFGPLLGAALGSILYIVLIGAHLDDVDEDGSNGSAGQVGADQDDWRSTKFIPKATVQSPQAPKQPQTTFNNNNQGFYPNQQAPVQAFNANNNGYNAGPGPQGGYNNNGFMPRDEMRNRQGY